MYIIMFILILLLALYIVCMKKSIRKLLEEAEEKYENSFSTNLTASSTDKDLLDIKNFLDKMISINKELRSENEESVREQRLMISNISHDLRTPLTVIIGYIDIMNKSADKEKYAHIIENKAYELLTLLNRFYDYSRIMSKNYIIDNDIMNLTEQVKESVFKYFEYFEIYKKSIDVSLEAKVIIFNDKENFDIIISNIMENMIKYSQGEERIELSSRDGRFVLRFSNKANIKNSKDINRIFERNFVLDSSRTKASTGLGLSIVKNLSSLMKLEVYAEYKDEILSICIEGEKFYKKV